MTVMCNVYIRLEWPHTLSPLRIYVRYISSLSRLKIIIQCLEKLLANIEIPFIFQNGSSSSSRLFLIQTKNGFVSAFYCTNSKSTLVPLVYTFFP